MAAPVTRELSDEEVFGVAMPDPDTDALVRTVWGEARGEDPTGRKAVAAVIRNRARLTGKPIREVVLAPGQFEPWGDTARRKEMEALDPSSEEYQRILADIQGDDDPTAGATHFYSPKAQAALGREPPEWDDGSGFEIGGHRFFRHPLEGQEAGPGRELSDEEVFGEAFEAQAEEPDFVGEVKFTAGPETALRPGKGFIDAKTGEALNEAQAATYGSLARAEKLDPNARPGSASFPLAQRSPDDLPKPGDWYVTVDGELRQVPEQSMVPTALNAVGLALGGPMIERLIPDDPRTAAIKRAGESGVLLGGRNEIVAATEALPAIRQGGIPLLVERFEEVLEREDARSGQARRDFPVAYNSAAALGGLASGVLIPGGGAKAVGKAAVGAGTGGASGFLATDGDLGERLAGATVGAVTGGALPLVAPRVAGAAADALRIPRRAAPDAMDRATAELERLGTRVDDLSPEARTFLQQQISEGVEPADAAVLALNRGLPVQIPLRRGDVTGLPNDQFEFNAALRGGRGPESAGEAQEFVTQQQGALREVADTLAARMAGTQGVPVRGQAGELISDVLANQRRAGEKAVDAAFDAARKQGESTWIARDAVPQLAGRLREAIAPFPPSRIGGTREALAKLDEIGGTTQVRDLFEVRSMLSSLRTEAGPDAAAAGAAVRELDRFIDEAVAQDLFSGDPGAVQQWKAAIKANREHAELFKQGDLVDRLTQLTGSGDARRLAVDPGDAANYILGRSGLGAVGRQGLYRDLAKLRDVLGPESVEWHGLRAEAFLRLTQAGEGGVEGGAQQFSGAKFLKAWNDAKARDMRTVELLFTPEERATINQFAALAAKVTSPVKGGDNPSNTALALKALQRMAALPVFAGKAFFITEPLVRAAEAALNRGAARKAMRPIPRKTPLKVPTRDTGGVLGGYAGGEAATSRDEPIY